MEGSYNLVFPSLGEMNTYPSFVIDNSNIGHYTKFIFWWVNK